MSCENLLILSDLHLGIPGITCPGGEHTSRADRELIAFLEHHMRTREDKKPWKLILNGDIFEFLRAAPPSDEPESAWGRDNGAGIVEVLDQILEAHHHLIERLAAFVKAGNSLLFIRGNHDPELHLPPVSARFVDVLVSLARPESDEERAAIAARVRFEPHAYYEPGRIFVEHGHMYDAFSAWHHEADGTSPEHMPIGTRIFRDMLNCYRGVDFFMLEPWSVTRAIFWLLRRHTARTIRLPWLYCRVVYRLLRHYVQAARQKAPPKASRRRFFATPGYASLSHIAGAIYLDKLIQLLLAFLVGALVASLHPLLGVVVGVAVFFVGSLVGKRLIRYDCHGTTARLRKVARKVARATRVPLVVFGHTHFPEIVRKNGSTYANVGTWLPSSTEDPQALRFFNRFVYLKVLRTKTAKLLPSLHRWCRLRGELSFVETSRERRTDQPLVGWYVPAL